MRQKLLPLLILLGVSAALLSACGSKGTPEERLASARALMDEGSYRAASIELKDLLQDEPRNAIGRLMLAEVNLGFGDVVGAEEQLGRAAEYGAPGDLVSPMHMQVLIAQGRLPDVLAAVDSVGGDLTAAQQAEYRGRALLGLRELDAAKSSFQAWLTSSPDDPDARLALAEADFALGEFAPAAVAIRELVEDYPETANFWNALGSVEAALGNYGAAEEALLRATGLFNAESSFSGFIGSRLALADIRLTQNKLGPARESVEELQSLLPGAPQLFYLNSRLLRAEGDLEESARQLQLLVNAVPNDLGARLMLAQAQLVLGNVGQAEELVESVIARDASNVAARKLLATIELNRASPDSALEALDPVSDIAADDSQFLSLLARAAIESGDLSAGIADLQSAADLDPDNSAASINLAAAYLRSGRADDALEVLRGVPKGDDFNASREGLWLVTLEAVEGAESARDYAESLLSDYSDNLLARFMVSEYYFRKGEGDRAYELVDEVAGFDTNEQIVASLASAQLDLRLGRPDKGRAILDAVLAAEPNQLGALIGKADLAVSEGDLDSARAALVTATENHPNAVTVKARLADVLFLQRDFEEAELLANDIVRYAETNGAIADVVGKIFLRSGRFRDAATNLEHALRFSPSSRDIALRLAAALSRSGKSVEALDIVGGLLQDDPDWVRGLVVQSGIQFEQGRLETALESVLRARALQRENLEATLLAARIYRASGRADEASMAFVEAAYAGAGFPAIAEAVDTRLAANLTQPARPLEEWLTRNPSDSTAQALLSQLYLSAGDYDRAIASYEKITGAAELSGVVLNNLAWLYQQKGDLAKAASLAEQAYAESPESGSIADTLAWIYYDDGRLEESLELLQKAVRLSPENGEISYHLAVVLVESGNRDEARDILSSLLSSEQAFPSRPAAESLLAGL